MITITFQHTCIIHRWLYENKLKSVPPEIGRLTSLQRLWLDRNQLEGLPPEIAGCSKLQVRARVLLLVPWASQLLTCCLLRP